MLMVRRCSRSPGRHTTLCPGQAPENEKEKRDASEGENKVPKDG
jgi:hypothetical protein